MASKFIQNRDLSDEERRALTANPWDMAEKRRSILSGLTGGKGRASKYSASYTDREGNIRNKSLLQTQETIRGNLNLSQYSDEERLALGRNVGGQGTGAQTKQQDWGTAFTSPKNPDAGQDPPRDMFSNPLDAVDKKENGAIKQDSPEGQEAQAINRAIPGLELNSLNNIRQEFVDALDQLGDAEDIKGQQKILVQLSRMENLSQEEAKIVYHAYDNLSKGVLNKGRDKTKNSLEKIEKYIDGVFQQPTDELFPGFKTLDPLMLA